MNGADLRDLKPPAHLDAAHKTAWKAMAAQLHPRVAGQPDALAFECFVRLALLIRLPEATAATFAQLRAYAGEFGLTPASRSKVAQTPLPTARTGFAALRKD